MNKTLMTLLTIAALLVVGLFVRMTVVQEANEQAPVVDELVLDETQETPEEEVVVEETEPALIEVSAPAANEAVTSPLTITGQARGYWYFEASFPVELLDDQNNVLATGTAQAQGDWMTEDFVPFTSTLTFTVPTGVTTGTLVLKKDNPSGEPENDQSISVPVIFAP